MPVHLNSETALFNIGKKTVKVSDWISYAQTFRYKPDGSGVKPYPQIWDEFSQSMAIDYYQAHLEDFNEDFRQQINEFKEGNLFFEIMQREVWGPAQTDTNALMEYYKANVSKYNWKPSVDAIIFYATDLASARIFSAELKKSPANWQSLVSNFSEKISADSARFENGQIPNAGNTTLKPGTITSPVVNKADNTASFAYIIRNHDKGETRSFAEAKGLVINDYQNDLEQSWIAVLKKKYPVSVEKKVVDDLVRNKKF
jgi:peptidyl-prolyl cis-trans isomerase SurA